MDSDEASPLQWNTAQMQKDHVSMTWSWALSGSNRAHPIKPLESPGEQDSQTFLPRPIEGELVPMAWEERISLCRTKASDGKLIGKRLRASSRELQSPMLVSDSHRSSRSAVTDGRKSLVISTRRVAVHEGGEADRP